MKKLILVVFLFSFTFAFGQKAIVKGKIISDISGKAPLEKPHIYIKEKVVGGIIDSIGQYQITNLEMNNNYTLLVSAFRYPKISKDIKTNDTITVVDFVLHSDCKYNKEQAELDIRIGKINLLLIGSIAPKANSETDNRFQKKYKVHYLDFGCSPPVFGVY
ncbi:MAG: carboxypeptidase-like regulatory domain-containing protein [Bacteroidetes bacterium]|nr:carboxypeptidase-like regulatory domain-containing protein [Bacteroidota bacterium]